MQDSISAFYESVTGAFISDARDNVRINIPSNSLVDENNNPYSGAFTASITYFDPLKINNLNIRIYSLVFLTAFFTQLNLFIIKINWFFTQLNIIYKD